MPEAVFAVPGDLAAPTGGYAYARRLFDLLPKHGIRAKHLALPGSFPFPTAEDLAETASLFARLPEGAPLLVDGLAYGALPPDVIRAAGSRTIVALVHHPLGLEPGLPSGSRAGNSFPPHAEPRSTHNHVASFEAPGRSPAAPQSLPRTRSGDEEGRSFQPASEAAKALIASEKAALALARRVIATSPFTARLLADHFGVPVERLAVAVPGTEPARRVEPRPGPRAHLLAVGAVTPRKGYDLLVEAVARLGDLDWRLTIVGALDRDPAHVEALRGRVSAMDLGGRIRLAGAVTEAELERLYQEADGVVSSSLFEGYGMALTEALARGLPLVVATGGAAGETVPDAAALKVPSGDIAALAIAIRSLVSEPERRGLLAEAAWVASRTLPRWGDTAAVVAAALREPQT